METGVWMWHVELVVRGRMRLIKQVFLLSGWIYYHRSNRLMRVQLVQGYYNVVHCTCMWLGMLQGLSLTASLPLGYCCDISWLRFGSGWTDVYPVIPENRNLLSWLFLVRGILLQCNVFSSDSLWYVLSGRKLVMYLNTVGLI